MYLVVGEGTAELNFGSWTMFWWRAAEVSILINVSNHIFEVLATRLGFTFFFLLLLIFFLLLLFQFPVSFIESFS
jgi:hypothetical protein